MKASDYSSNALICYRVGDIQKLKEDFEEGVQVANEGMARFPDYPYLLRMKLWNQGGMTTVPRIPSDEKKIMWDSLYVTSQAFKELPDSFQRLFNDYRWMALASMETKHYSEAIKLFKQQIEAGGTDSIQYALALRNMVDCYTNLELYDDAEKAYFRYEDYKKEMAMEMTIADYQKLFLVYYYQGGDTLSMAPDRINFLQKADSLLVIMGEISPENIGYVNNTRLRISLLLAGLEGKDYSYPPVFEAANRLVKSMLAVDESDREPNDWYYMICGMRYAMEYYIQTDLRGEAWVCADEILGLPMSKELKGLALARTKDYDQYTNRAKSLIDHTTYSTPGKKLKKSGWRPF
jgi:tetratricopeptide (TPR) repeat protein